MEPLLRRCYGMGAENWTGIWFDEKVERRPRKCLRTIPTV